MTKGWPDSANSATHQPVAIVDIGSNSVRLVAYDALSRAPTPIFNEKVLCGLGRGVHSSGLLPVEGVRKALLALARFRVLVENMRVASLHVLATAAVRDALNGAEFLVMAEAAIGCPIRLLSGFEEARMSALGVISGIHLADGVVGDLGGGSLELINVKSDRPGKGVTLPLGGLVLADASKGSAKAAVKIARDALTSVKLLKKLNNRSFYAVGGTWRALAKLHMRQRNYPLKVMQNYVIPARDALDFTSLIERVDSDALVSIGAVSTSRRPLLAYGAIVLDEIIRIANPRDIVLSASGVREGLLFSQISEDERRSDPLLLAAGELNAMRARDPAHAFDLCAWTDEFIRTSHIEETPEEIRLRHASCLLADIGWRAHPDYRGEQSMNLITHASFFGIDHAGRAFLGLVSAFRHEGIDADVSPQIRALASARLLDRARLLGAALRVGYIVSTAMSGILPQVPLTCSRTHLTLGLPPKFAALGSGRLVGRLRQLARLIGREAVLAGTLGAEPLAVESIET